MCQIATVGGGAEESEERTTATSGATSDLPGAIPRGSQKGGEVAIK